jgi:hypothetical protein
MTTNKIKFICVFSLTTLLIPSLPNHLGAIAKKCTYKKLNLFSINEKWLDRSKGPLENIFCKKIHKLKENDKKEFL